MAITGLRIRRLMLQRFVRIWIGIRDRVGLSYCQVHPLRYLFDERQPFFEQFQHFWLTDKDDKHVDAREDVQDIGENPDRRGPFGYERY